MAEWLFTVNDQVREREGGQAFAAIISILRSAAAAAPGSTQAHLEKAVRDAAATYGRPLADTEVRGIAGNLAVPDLTLVRVVDGSGRHIAEIPVSNEPSDIPDEDRSENVHVEPEDGDRPLYS